METIESVIENLKPNDDDRIVFLKQELAKMDKEQLLETTYTILDEVFELLKKVKYK